MCFVLVCLFGWVFCFLFFCLVVFLFVSVAVLRGRGGFFVCCVFLFCFFVCFVFVTVVCLLLLYLSVFTAHSLRLCLNSPSAAKHHIPFGACERVLFKWNQFDTYV